jgi:hypothetical protein
MLTDGRPGAIVNVSSVHQLIPKPKFLELDGRPGTVPMTRWARSTA